MSEIQPDDSEKYDILLNLMNEGMATYVAYSAREAYTAAIKDYVLLDDPAEVSRLTGEMNALLSSVGSFPADVFRQQILTSA